VWVGVKFHETLFLAMLYVGALDIFFKHSEKFCNNGKKYQFSWINACNIVLNQ